MYKSFRTFTSCVALSSLVLLTLGTATAANVNKDATAKVLRGKEFKGKTTFGLGAFRVAFVTEDKVASVAKGFMSGGGGASSLMEGAMVGIDHPLMQKITDEIYADFLKQAAAHGLTIVESQKLIERAPSYKAMQFAEGLSEGRLGTVIIPTGQQSVPLAADNSHKADRGARGMMAGVHDIGLLHAKAEANAAFPVAAKEAGMPIMGVTIVVNFADFKGGTSTFGTTAKTQIMAGATIDGAKDLASSTSILVWDANTPSAPGFMGQVILEGRVHSTEKIGTLSSFSTMKAGDHIANAISMLGTGSQSKKKGSILTADPVAYEANVLLVAAEATGLLLTGMAKEK